MSSCPAGHYKHRGLCCPKCPAGYHKEKDCSETQTTKCSPCGPDVYMDFENYVNYCLRCSECEKGSNLIRLRACTPTSDTRCGCNRGFYCSVHHSQRCERCREISSCPPGHGVTARATQDQDTQCEPCSPGSFSNVTDSITPCHRHTQCPEIGQQTLFAGTSVKDTICTNQFETPQPSLSPGCTSSVPTVSDGSFLIIVMCGIILSMLGIILSVGWSRRKARARTAKIRNSDHSPTEVMDEILQLKMVKVLLDKPDSGLDRAPCAQRDWHCQDRANTLFVSVSAPSHPSPSASTPPLLRTHCSLDTDVPQGMLTLSRNDPIYQNLDIVQSESERQLLVSTNHIEAPGAERSPPLSSLEGRCLCTPAPLGSRESAEGPSGEEGSEGSDYCDLETDSAEVAPRFLPEKCGLPSSYLPPGIPLQTELRSDIPTEPPPCYPGGLPPGVARGTPTLTASEMFDCGVHRPASIDRETPAAGPHLQPEEDEWTG